MKKLLLVIVLLSGMGLLAACSAQSEDKIQLSEASVTDARLTPSVSFENGTYIVDTEASTMYWEAYKPVGGHNGGISLEKGELIVKDGQPAQGSFTIDMNTITDADLPESMQSGLLNHLKSDDFFAVADYPFARFDITRVTPYEEGDEFNYQVEGDLSIRDITKPVTVLAKIEAARNGRITAKAKTMVDRTQFDITIRSGSFFEELGDKLIKDEFLLEMDLVAGLN
jgi:polyisoprenoid-binding protein YceI